MTTAAAGDSRGRWTRMLSFVALAAAAWVVILLAAALWWAGSGSLLQALGAVTPALWLATFATFAVNHLLRFVRWHWMLVVEGHRVPALRSFAVFMAGIALTPTPGKAGVAVRSLLLLRDGVPANVSLAMYFAERVFDFLGLVVLAALLLGTAAHHRWIALAAGAAAVVVVLVGPRVAAAIEARLAPGTRLRRAAAWSRMFLAHSAELVSSRYFAPFWLLGFAANAITGLLLWLALGTLGAPVAIEHALGTLGVSHLSGSLSLLPGGLGGFELAMLAQLAALGSTPAAALVGLALVRLVTIWAGVAVGLPLLGYGLKRHAASGGASHTT